MDSYNLKINGAGYRPEIEDVWKYDDSNDHPVLRRNHFISEFITYARNRDELRNQALAEIEYSYDEE